MSAHEESEPIQRQQSFTRALLLLTIFATIGGALFGYDTGVVSGVEVFLEHDRHLSLSKFQIQQVVSATVGAAAVGTAISGLPLQWYGRRPLIIAASILYVLGSVLLALAHDFVTLMVGRISLGFGVGLSSIAIPVYLSELSPSQYRGRVVACYTSSIVFGQLVACIANIAADEWLRGSMKWRTTLGIAAIPAAIQLAGFVFGGLPESPRWLLSKGRNADAVTALMFIRNENNKKQSSTTEDNNTFVRIPNEYPLYADVAGNDVYNNDGAATYESPGELLAACEAELAELQAAPSEDIGDISSLISHVWGRPHYRRIFQLGMGLQLIQQLSGINTLMYYGGHILELCGFGRGNSVKLAAVLAVAQGLGLAISTPLFDRMGRRALVLPSAFASGICIGIVAVAFQLGKRNDESGGDDDDDDDDEAGGGLSKVYGILALIGLLGYLLAFGCGLSPGPWVINAEIYPLHIRGLGNSAATTTNWLANYAVSATFLSLIAWLGEGGTFALFALICFMATAWLYARLPETSGLSLEAIEDLFRRPDDVPAHESNSSNENCNDNRTSPVASPIVFQNHREKENGRSSDSH